MENKTNNGTLWLDEGLYITAPAPPDFRPGNGGGGPGLGGWGLTNGPRTNSSHSGELSRQPSFGQIIQEEYKSIRRGVDRELAPLYNDVEKNTESEIRSLYATIPSTLHSDAARRRAEQHALLNLVNTKQAHYATHRDHELSLWGSPLFYKPALYFHSVAVRALRSQDPRTEFAKAFSTYETAYRASHICKITDLSLRKIQETLDALPPSFHSHDELSPLTYEQKISLLTADIGMLALRQATQLQLLPDFLRGVIPSFSNTAHHDDLIASLHTQLSVIGGQVQSRARTVAPYSVANPNIAPPLTRSEIEALNSLILDQEQQRIGPRWLDYHHSILHSDSVRVLTDTQRVLLALLHQAEHIKNILSAVSIEESSRRQRAEEALKVLEAQRAEENRLQKAKLDNEARLAAQNAEAERITREAARQAEAERITQQAAKRLPEKPRIKQAAEQPIHIRKAKKAAKQAAAERREREAFEKAEARRAALKAAQKAKADAQALRAAQKADAQRKAREAAEREKEEKAAKQLARLAERERKHKELTQKAAESRMQKEKERARSTYTTINNSATSLPSLAITYTSNVETSSRTYPILKHAIRTAVASGAHALVATLAMTWPSRLGNSDRHYVVSIPLTDLSPVDGPDLNRLALSTSSLDVPHLLAGSENQDSLDVYVIPGGKPIAVHTALFDTKRNVYRLVLDSSARILTWTPAQPPGHEPKNATSLPAIDEGILVYSGNSPDPITNGSAIRPPSDLLDQERIIVTFPSDSGLPPLLVVFRDPRMDPGVVSGAGSPQSGRWLGEQSRQAGALIPDEIDSQLVGKPVKNMKEFRELFWKAVAHSSLADQFASQNVTRMLKGLAPKTPMLDAYKMHSSFVLHHHVPISEGGDVYNLDNIRIVTPTAHQNIHYGNGNGQ